MGSQIDVVFNADTGRYVANVNAATGATTKSAEAVALAKNKILEAMESQVQKAQSLGASQERLQAIVEKSARQMSAVTEDNAKRMIASLDRIAEKNRMVQAELNNLKVPKGADEYGHGLSDKQAASAVLRGGGLRSGENVLSMLAPSGVLQTAGLAFGVTALASVLFEMGEKGYAAFEKVRQGAELTRAAFAEMHSKSEILIDDKEIENQKIQDQIDKLSGKPNNGLALALLEAKKMSDQLVASMKDVRTQEEAIFKQTDTGALGKALSALGFGPTTTGTQKDEILKDGEGLEKTLQVAGRTRNAAMASATDDAGREAATKAYNKSVHDAFQERIDTYLREKKRLEDAQNAVQITATRNGIIRSHEDHSQQIANLDGVIGVLQDKQQDASLDESIYAGNTKLGGLKQGKDAAEEKLKALEAYVNVWKMMGVVSDKAIFDFWEGQKSQFAKGSSEFDSILGKQAQLAEEGARKAAEAIAKYKAQQSELSKMDAPRLNGNVMGNTSESASQLSRARGSASLADAENAAELARTKVQIAESTGAISKLAADQQLAAIAAAMHTERLKDLNAQITELKSSSSSYNALTDSFGSDKDAKAYLELQEKVRKEDTQQAVDEYQSAAKIAGDSWSGALKDANNEWVQNARDSAAQVKALFNQALDGLNDNLSNLMTGKKTNFSGMFQGLGKTLTTDGLKHAEAGILGKFGVEGKPDGSSSKPFYVKIAGSMGLGGAGGGSTSSLFSSKSISGIWQGISGLFGGGGSNAGVGTDGSAAGDSAEQGIMSSIFGGGLAVGGDVTAGTTYLVGEQGPELFTSGSHGSITPNHKLGGSTVQYNVSVANGVTPEQFDMKMRSALQQYHPHAVRASVAAMRDANARRPQH